MISTLVVDDRTGGNIYLYKLVQLALLKKQNKTITTKNFTHATICKTKLVLQFILIGENQTLCSVSLKS